MLPPIRNTVILQCFYAVGWVTRRASDLYKFCHNIFPKVCFSWTGLTWSNVTWNNFRENGRFKRKPSGCNECCLCSAWAVNISALCPTSWHHRRWWILKLSPWRHWALVHCCHCLARSLLLLLLCHWVTLMRKLHHLVIKMQRWSLKALVSPLLLSLHLRHLLSAWCWWAACGSSTSKQVRYTNRTFLLLLLFCYFLPFVSLVLIWAWNYSQREAYWLHANTVVVQKVHFLVYLLGSWMDLDKTCQMCGTRKEWPHKIFGEITPGAQRRARNYPLSNIFCPSEIPHIVLVTYTLLITTKIGTNIWIHVQENCPGKIFPLSSLFSPKREFEFRSNFGVSNLKLLRCQKVHPGKMHPWHVLYQIASIWSSKNVSAALEPRALPFSKCHVKDDKDTWLGS